MFVVKHRWVTCDHSMANTQIAVGGDSLQIWRRQPPDMEGSCEYIE
jgi:hypothetical protein